MRLSEMVDKVWEMNEGSGDCAGCVHLKSDLYGPYCGVIANDLHPGECPVIVVATPYCYLDQVA